MTERNKQPRTNQLHRTRKDLLAAAARLLKAGRTPAMDEIAAEAMVSRATAYRYFPTVDALLTEAPLDGEVPDPNDIFAHDQSTDPVQRLDKAETVLHEMCYRNEALLRVMLAASMQRTPPADSDAVPIRQNRRTPLIQAALAPARNRFTKSNYEKLCAALALVFGTESMVVFKDVLNIDEKTARKVKSWAIRALVEAALEDTRSSR